MILFMLRDLIKKDIKWENNMSTKLNNKAISMIVNHMNEDHEDALILYVMNYHNIKQISKAQLIDFDSLQMTIRTEYLDIKKDFIIKFDHELKDANDAHTTLVQMAKSFSSK